MTYFILPQIEYDIRPSNLKLLCKEMDDDNGKLIISLKKYLNKIKGLIDKHISQWDNTKKYTNPYEFIHTNVPNTKNSISKIKPISRAFFKLIEIYNTHHLLPQNDIPLKSFHLAEGPGGFIEATTYLRTNSNDKYYGMTLIEDKNINIPGWNKVEFLLKKYPNIELVTGADKTGDLYKEENLKYIIQKHAHSMDIVTADGGFDFSADFNKQEQLAFRLIFTQVIYALVMQKKNGHFVLKIFDIFEDCTIDILYLLSSFYEKVIIMKPYTSRYANSEKYVVCKYFKYEKIDDLYPKFVGILKFFNGFDFSKYKIKSILDIPIQNYYVNSINEINAILGHQQIDNILNTIKIITHKDKKQEKIYNLKCQNVTKCINWCIKNNIP
ncbi:MAG: SAM-dependent methyltransferase, partial [Flavobacteriales bacterium]|nr:SAM-dependent methyltransferase [Flavobacteriales bacterium]